MSHSHGSHRRRHSHKSRSATTGFGLAGEQASVPRLVRLTDVCFWTTLVAVSACFGGRSGTGQLVLVSGAAATALCWLLHQFTTDEPRYTWTGSEWLWVAGLLIGVVQIMPLSRETLLAISPRLAEILPLVFSGEAKDIFPDGWKSLSLAPSETASGIATFAAYGLLFLVAAQRIRTIKDVEASLCGAALASCGMMAFAVLQFLTANGKFFWYYEHPFMSTHSYLLGSFTNRNHLCQFLVLGLSPLVWWLLRRIQQQAADNMESGGIPPLFHGLSVMLLATGILGVSLTVLFTLSRGGLLAMTVSTVIGLGLMYRYGLAPGRLLVVLGLIGLVGLGYFSTTKYEALLSNRLDGQSGRMEIWMANVRLAGQFPILGTGVGTHADAYHLTIAAVPDTREYTHAECGYLQVASETGLVGLTVAFLFILTGLWWSVGALWHPETRYKSAAAVCLAGLLANVVHALGDFFWYTPACMVLLALQMACAFRLHRLAKEANGGFVRTWATPRLLTMAGGLGVACLSFWMIDQKIPAARAEGDRNEYLLMANRPAPANEVEEDRWDRIRDRSQLAIQTAKLDPRDSRALEAAARGYLDLFSDVQEEADNPMSYAQLRDAVKSSSFETVVAANEWMQVAIGKNLKYLKAADKLYRKSLRASPLRAGAYLRLAELHFLNHIDEEREGVYLEQAQRIRPNEADVLFAVGRHKMLLSGNQEDALELWAKAFPLSPSVQEQVSQILAPTATPVFVLERLNPDWKAVDVLARAFFNEGREEEARTLWDKFIEEGLARTKGSKLSESEAESTYLLLQRACHSMSDPDQAIRILGMGVKRIPRSHILRNAYAWDLYNEGRYAEAAEHLKWLAVRNPENRALQQALIQAMRERVRTVGARSTGD